MKTKLRSKRINRKRRNKNNLKKEKMTVENNPKVRMHFVGQVKGGAGKSTYVYNVGNLTYDKGLRWLFVDMDNEINATLKQLKYLKSVSYDLIDKETDSIDRQKLDAFFIRALKEADKKPDEVKTIVVDLGAHSSEQFLIYLQKRESLNIFKMASKKGIEFHMHCVLNSRNGYQECSEYCESLFTATNGISKNHIAQNMQFSYTEVQQKDIETMSKTYNADVIKFNLISESGNAALDNVRDMMLKGLPMSESDDWAAISRYDDNLMTMNFPLN